MMPRIKNITSKKEVIKNPYMLKKAKILEFKRECPHSFTIKTDFSMNHEPGQFVQIYIPGIGEAPISIASFSNKFSEFHIREVGNVTKELAKLKKGDPIWIRGPYGTGYPLEKFHGKNILIIGGGSGVAPLKGIISYVEKNKTAFDNVEMFFGFRNKEEIIFKDQMASWAKKYNLHISIDKNTGKSKIKWDVCFVTQILEKQKPKPNNSVAFICGPPVMMNAVIEILRNIGWSYDNIYISAERLMHCALGVCGHCMIHGKYTCLDGPVFKYSELSAQEDKYKIKKNYTNKKE